MNFKSTLSGNVELIERLLVDLNLYNVRMNRDGFRFALEEDGNPTAISLNPESLKFFDFKTSKSGDILDLICLKLGCTVSKGIQWLKNFLGIDVGFGEKVEESEFKRAIRGIKENIEDEIRLVEYEDSVLDSYEKIYSKLFQEDGIGCLAHVKFDIRYDDETDRILIPIRNKEGKLVGIIGRLNTRNVPRRVAKYYPLIRYPKTRVLYGLYENWDYLDETMIIVESEKSVIKAFTYGYRNVVALGGNRVSEYHLELIRERKPKRVILALDKGLEDEHIIEQARKLFSKNPFIKINVGFIDSNHVDLPDKSNIFDLDKDKCEEILSNTRWLGYKDMREAV